jgi:Na+/H+-dicarboxylate symporter
VLSFSKKYKFLLLVVLSALTGTLVGSSVHSYAVIDFFELGGKVIGAFISFFVPLIIVAFVTQGINSLKIGSGKLLGMVLTISYCSMIFASLLACFVGISFFGIFFKSNFSLAFFENAARESIFANLPRIELKPLFDIIPAMFISFMLGLGINAVKSKILRAAVDEFYKIIELVIRKVIISILPFYVLCMFVKLSVSGGFMLIAGIFYKVFIAIILMQTVMLLIQFTIAGILSKKNPLELIKNVVTVYFTAFATQSSAAAIPASVEGCRRNGVSEAVANFVAPLCSTIHLTGSIVSITSSSIAVMMINGRAVNFLEMLMFAFLLGIVMVAAPAVPCGAILAASSLLTSFLNFDSSMVSLMIALHSCQDCFGTACNVCGDNAIAIIVESCLKKSSQ